LCEICNVEGSYCQLMYYATLQSGMKLRFEVQYLLPLSSG